VADQLHVTNLGRDAVTVTGPEAVTYLQGQLSQDVGALEVGASAWSWLLQPAGKVDALVRVTRLAPDALLVDVDEGHGGPVLNRLNRFKLRTKAEIVPGHIDLMALRGPGALDAARVAEATLDPELGAETALGGRAAIVVTALWPAGGEAADVLVRPGSRLTLADSDRAVEWKTDDWEPERIAAGVPAMGAELTEKTIPAETGLVAITASFTKGCYTGQELVARIDSRGGNVPRHLRRLRSASPLTSGDELTNADGKLVGAVTSAAVHPELGPVALGYVARSVAAGDPVLAPSGPVAVLGLGDSGDA
jgi:tRNA-modifying protein YgfZ